MWAWTVLITGRPNGIAGQVAQGQKKISVYAGVYNVDYCKYLYDIRKELLLLNRICYLQSR